MGEGLLMIMLMSAVLLGACNKIQEHTVPVVTIKPDEDMPPIGGTPLIWGFDDAGANRPPVSDISRQIFQQFGFDLVVHHYQAPDVTYAGNFSRIQDLHDFYTSVNAKWIINLESANWGRQHIDERGYDWYNHSEGRHFWQFPAEILQGIAALPNKPGIMYDEPEHMQNSRNSATISGFEAPFMLSDAKAESLEKAADNFTEETGKIAQQYTDAGLDVYTEHVFPIQYHTFARGGFIPVSKILKEGVSPAFIATSIGACLQYDKPFWLTPDLWHVGNYPGHSVDTYRSSLLLAYHMGAEAIYTENISHDQNNQGKGSLILVNAARDNYSVTPYGEAALWFRKTYAPQNPRHYTYKELKPRVVIIRQEDASWGQSNSGIPDWLFGVKSWGSNATTEAWLHIWHLLSRGQMSEHSISWHNREARKIPYQLLYPLDGVVVFDHHVRMPHIKDAELIFLTGVGVSEPTLNDVIDKVKQGAVCVTLPHLAPAEVRAQTGNNGTLTDGQGKWIVTESFLSLVGSSDIEPFLPTGDYMRYQFGDKEVRFTPVGGNINRIEVNVNQTGN